MKRTLMIVALVGAFASAAHAQSSVTLYGLVDAGITYTNNQNGHSNWEQLSGTLNASRWGLTGAEDLGAGLKAVFTLENGFDINDGKQQNGGRAFGRQAFIGVGNDLFGAVTLGRQYDSAFDFLGPFSLAGTQYGYTQFAHPYDNDNLDGFRINNSVKYQSPNIAGFKFGAMYGFSNAAGQFTNNRAYSVGASYTYACVNIGAAYLQLNNNLTPGSAFNAAGAVTGDQTFLAGRQQTWGAGANCTFGPVTAGIAFTQTNLSQDPGISAGQSGLAGGVDLGSGSSHFQNIETNVRYALTPAVTLAGSYTYTRGSVESVHAHWNQFNLLADYALSTRTDVYLEGVYQRVNEGSGLVAYINGLGAASSNNGQVAVTAGLRHRF